MGQTLDGALVPEEHFERVPLAFGGVSRLINGRPVDGRMGIMLASLEEVVQLLQAYQGAIFDAAHFDGPAGLPEALSLSRQQMPGWRETASLPNNYGLPYQFNTEGRQVLAKQDQFRGWWDYWWLAADLKTEITVYKADDTYVLVISDNHDYQRKTDEKIEDVLAKAFDKRRALVSADIIAELDRVDGWWFNLDAESLFTSIKSADTTPRWKKFFHYGKSSANALQVAEWLARVGSSDLTVNCGGRKILVRPKLVEFYDRDKIVLELPPGSSELQGQLIQVRGTHVIGPSWSMHRSSRGTFPQPTHVEISLLYANPFFLPIVSAEMARPLLAARDYIMARL